LADPCWKRWRNAWNRKQVRSSFPAGFGGGGNGPNRAGWGPGEGRNRVGQMWGGENSRTMESRTERGKRHRVKIVDIQGVGDIRGRKDAEG